MAPTSQNPPPPVPPPLEAVRQQLHQKRDEAFRTMLEPGCKFYQLDFSAREQEAHRIAQDLARSLLQHSVDNDPLSRAEAESQTWPCPACGTKAPQHKGPDQKPAVTSCDLTTEVGQTSMKFHSFRCPQCRKVFSPL